MRKFQQRTSYTSIVGLSTTLRMPRLGKIRLGIKIKKAQPDSRCKHALSEACIYCTYPKDVDYFVCPPEVQAIHGDKPTELDILIPTEDQSLFFPQSLKMYDGNRLICKGNGQEATRINTKTGDMATIECPCEFYGNKCGERANLMVLLPRVSMSGAYQIDTGSVNNIIEINSTIQWLRGMIGRVAFVPMKLRRVVQSVQITDALGKVSVQKKALLKMTFEANIQQIAQLREADIITIEGGQKLLPPAPVEDGPDDAAGVVVETNMLEEAVKAPIHHKDGTIDDLLDPKTPSTFTPTNHDFLLQAGTTEETPGKKDDKRSQKKTRTIDRVMQTQIFDLAKKNKVDMASVKDIIESFGYHMTKDIRVEDYIAVIKKIEEVAEGK